MEKLTRERPLSQTIAKEGTQPGDVFPSARMRRLRSSSTLRSMVKETHVRVEQMIYPFFLVEGNGVKNLSVRCPAFTSKASMKRSKR